MQLEKVISINENLYSAILNNAFDAIIYYTPVRDEDGSITDFTFRYMNDSSFRILKGTREDYIGKAFLTFFPYSTANGMLEDFIRTAETGLPAENTYYYSEVDYSGWYRNSIIKAGDGIIVYFRDVTESMQMELNLKQNKNELQESLNLISNIIESIKDPFLVIDKEYRVVYANAAMEYWFKGSAPYKGKLLWDLVPESYTIKTSKILKEFMDKHTYKSFKMRGLFSDRSYYVSVYPFYGGVSIYAQDITEKLRVEEQLRTSLKEKEILLKEIHHRVKNNLQLVASMINLQCTFVKDPVYSELLNDSKNRISTMALIHKRLYEENNYASIRFKSFAEELVKSLFELYKIEGKKIVLKCSIEDINAGLDYSINIGLILNELITNSMKYAFRGRSDGELKVEIKKSSDKFLISVKDNGIGFPEGIDYRNAGSLGLLIVNSLVDQLDGVIELERDSGTNFIIKLNKEKKNQLNFL